MISRMIPFADLKAALERQPFTPIRIEAVRGRTYDVASPSYALLTRTVLVLGTSVADDGVPEHFVEVPVEGIFKLEPIE